MSISNIIIKVIGVILAVVGLGLVLSILGINFLGISVAMSPISALIIGGLLIGAGIYIVKGGNITA